ncbi:MAG: hypothetical protein NTV21_04370 [Planctomycetota bacterium]|nr:hypothetical protein [Planctomycetota bacterium]
MLLAPRLALAALTFTFVPSVADSLEFKPAAGLERAKTFSMDCTFGLGDMLLTVDGQDMTGAADLGDVSGKLGLSLDVVDHYLKSADGRPLLLERQYTKSGMAFDMDEESSTETDLFELDGKTVVFEWDADKGEYKRTLKDGGENEALVGLGVDLDYRTLLPGRAVSVGDKWEVAPADLTTALFFGTDVGDLLAKADEDAEAAEMLEQFGPALERLFGNFKAQCEYVGLRDLDGVRVAEIKLVIDSDGTLDLRDLVQSALEGQIGGEGLGLDLQQADVSLEIRGEGRLLLDTTAHHAHSFQLATNLGLELEMAMSISDPQGGDHSAEMQVEILGELAWKME